MQMFSAILVSGLLLINVTGVTYAQDTIRLSFQEAVKLAMKNNVDLRQEKNNLEISLANRKESRAMYAPGVAGYSAFQRLNGQQFDQVTGTSFRDNTDNANLNVGASYIVFDGFARLNSNKRTQALLESQRHVVTRTEQDIIYAVAQQYLQVLLDQELLRISEQNLEVQATTLRQIEGFVEAGTRPLSDQLDQEATVSQIEVEMIRAQNALRLDKARLKQTLLLDPSEQIEPVDPEWGFESVLVRNYDLEELYQSAMNNRTDYKSALAEQEAADAAINIARSNHYPELSLFGSAGTRYSSQLKMEDNPEVSIPFSSQFEDNSIFSYGLELNIPIYSRYTVVAQKTRAKMAYENAKLVEEDLRLLIYNEVQNAYLSFVASKDEYYAAMKQFEAAQAAYNIQKERYEVGVGNLVELSRSTGTFVDAAGSRAQAQYTLLFQKVILDYFTGVLNKEGI
ncbi:MAG: TolC family protein [Cyclobacteriaceae bacterium]|nr:TolC family protein [Cyclobacteriaceae bacterium]